MTPLASAVAAFIAAGAPVLELTPMTMVIAQETQTIPPGLAYTEELTADAPADLYVMNNVESGKKLTLLIVTPEQNKQIEAHGLSGLVEGRDYIREVEISGPIYGVSQSVPPGSYDIVFANPGDQPVKVTFSVTAQRPK